MAKLTNSIIEAAIHGFEAQKKTIDTQIAELRAMLAGAPETPAEEAPRKRGRRKFSAAARQKMREAQQRRWAKIKGKPKGTPAAPKRKLSAAGREAIRTAMKKRWAAKKSAAA